MQNYQISQELHSFSKTFERTLSKPQLGRLKEMMHGIIRGQEANLSEMARQNRRKAGKTVRKQVEQYSDILECFPMEELLIQKLKGLRGGISPDTPLYYDLVDISKKHTKGFEDVGATWDGSEGEPGKGYEIIDVSVLKKDCATTLWRHLYSTAEKGYKSELEEMEKVLKYFQIAWGGLLGSWYFDEGNDSNKKIDLCLNYEMTFTIRMNVNRGNQDRIMELPDGERVKMMELWGEKAQGMTMWQSKRKKKDKRLVQLQWRQITWRHQGEVLPLYLVWFHREGDPRPGVFLTSQTIENEARAAKVYHGYFDRGKEEAGFKRDKFKLGMEKVQLRSIQRTKQLMKVYVLVDQLLSKIYLTILEMDNFIYDLLKGFLKGTQRTITKWSIADWYDALCSQMEHEFIRFKRRYPPGQANSQPSLFPNPLQIW